MTTLLSGVNEVMKRAKLIQGDSGELATLTDSPRQVWIDQIVQIWNEVMEELYSVSEKPMPQELAKGSITLVTDDRDYALASFTTIYWPLVNETDGQHIYEWKGGYLSLYNSQPIPTDFTGLPLYGVIRETDSQLYLDRIPTISENGDVYAYHYDKDVSMSTAASTFPFQDDVFRSLVPVVADVFKAENRKDAMITAAPSIGRASRILSNVTVRTHYGNTRPQGTGGIMFPFEQ